MKKNRMMRLASILLICVLLTTSVISGTFAKYTSSYTSEDHARIAYWGFGYYPHEGALNLTNLFQRSYDNVQSNNEDDVIAPGTSGQTSFQFLYNAGNGATGPEVAYTFTVDVEAECGYGIWTNRAIQWKLDDGNWGNWDALIEDIKALSGDPSGTKVYEPNTLPEAFGLDNTTHTIYWQWIFEYPDSETHYNDGIDTAIGNATEENECSIKITISATQVD